MNAATIFKTLTTVTLSITLLMTGGCNNMETKKEESGLISKSCYGCTDSSKQAALGFRGSG